MKALSFQALKAELLQDEEVKQLYLQEKRVEELQSLLQGLRKRAGLTVSEVALRMGVTQPAVSKLERNASRASFLTLQRYAQACGSELRVGAV